jgi:hypothetical protein
MRAQATGTVLLLPRLLGLLDLLGQPSGLSQWDDLTMGKSGADRQKAYRGRIADKVAKLREAVAGDTLAQELAAAYFEAARQRVDIFLAELVKKPMEFDPPTRAKILAHMEGWRESFDLNGPIAPEALLQIVREAADTLAWGCMREDLKEQVLIHSPAEQPDEAA